MQLSHFTPYTQPSLTTNYEYAVSEETTATAKADCITCALPMHHCICKHSPNIVMPSPCTILFHPRELSRRNSSGRLLLSCTNTQKAIWHRLKAESLSEKYAGYHLIFPATESSNALNHYSDARSNQEELCASDQVASNTDLDSMHFSSGHNHKNSPKGYIWIDATWQESQKIMRQSPWLRALKRVSLQPDNKSVYRLRRNQKSHGLSTLESMALWLYHQHHTESSQALLDYFERFQHQYLHAQQAGELK